MPIGLDCPAANRAGFEDEKSSTVTMTPHPKDDWLGVRRVRSSAEVLSGDGVQPNEGQLLEVLWVVDGQSTADALARSQVVVWVVECQSTVDVHARSQVEAWDNEDQSGLPFFTEHITFDPGPALGNLFKHAPTLYAPKMFNDFAPELSAQLITAATGKPHVILSLDAPLPALPAFQIGRAHV